MSVSVACKPSSVEGGHLSRPIVAEGFKRNPESLTGRLKRSFVSCSEWGLHRGQVARPRVSSYLTFPPLHARGHAVSLCCTLPGVAPAGRYPALCPMELGLSSHLSARGRPAASQTCAIIAHLPPPCQRSYSGLGPYAPLCAGINPSGAHRCCRPPPRPAHRHCCTVASVRNVAACGLACAACSWLSSSRWPTETS